MPDPAQPAVTFGPVLPNRIEVKRNEQIRFVLKNSGELAHEFVLRVPTTTPSTRH